MPHKLAKVISAAVLGLDATPIEVEVDTSPGLHFFHIVGLPDKAVEESRDRIESAIRNSGFKPPKSQNIKVVVNLAPADVKKEGPWYDLPIAIAYLLATQQVSFNPDKKIFIGELALDGKLRHAKGVLPIALMAHERGYNSLVVPYENLKEALVVKKLNNDSNHSVDTIGVSSLVELIAYLSGKIEKPVEIIKEELSDINPKDISDFDISYIAGQNFPKRGLEIAAAGGHNLLMVGQPGSGKTMLARALVSILPEMNPYEALEVTKIYSVSGYLKPGEYLINQRPFRNPHHTISAVAMIGGGTHPKPGEISLAHRGVLFMDEFPEFGRYVIESLRQPLEDGKITVSRAAGSISYPARFQLVAAMNPCPCGNFGDPEKACICGPGNVLKYQKKISGPFLDRIDIQLRISREKLAKIKENNQQVRSSDVRKNVEGARLLQHKRLKLYGMFTNAEMSNKQVNKFCQIDSDTEKMLENFVTQKHLSMRTYFRILKIARTIADLYGSDNLLKQHVAEAISFRADEQLLEVI